MLRLHFFINAFFLENFYVKRHASVTDHTYLANNQDFSPRKAQRAMTILMREMKKDIREAPLVSSDLVRTAALSQSCKDRPSLGLFPSL